MGILREQSPLRPSHRSLVSSFRHSLTFTEISYPFSTLIGLPQRLSTRKKLLFPWTSWRVNRYPSSRILRCHPFSPCSLNRNPLCSPHQWLLSSPICSTLKFLQYLLQPFPLFLPWRYRNRFHRIMVRWIRYGKAMPVVSPNLWSFVISSPRCISMTLFTVRRSSRSRNLWILFASSMPMTQMRNRLLSRFSVIMASNRNIVVTVSC